MAKKYFLPRKDEDKLLWLKNFNEKLATYATLLGVTPDEVSATDKFYLLFAYTMGASTSFSTFSQDITAFKNNLLKGQVGSELGDFPPIPTLAAVPALSGAGSLTTTTDLIQRMKIHPKYTVGIGEDLGIEGADQVLDPAQAKPKLSGAFENNAATLKFSSFEMADGVRIEGMRSSETVFSFLATDTESPYIDNRQKLDASKPETRKYRAIFYDNVADNVMGNWSDEVTIVVP